MADAGVDLRPRTIGEILDDAWRLALADAPLLVLFSTLFLVPAFCVLLLLLAQPESAGAGGFLLPALAAVLLPTSGIGSGACQDLFRRRVEDRPAGAAECLREALRHGLEHAAARAVVLVAVVVGMVLLVVPGLMAWVAATPVHALIAAGRGRTGGVWRELTREAAFNPGKAAVVTLTRVPLLVLAAINLHLLFQVLLWVGDNLAGFDVVLLAVEMEPFANPVYAVALLLLSWLLLAPFFEAANFLLYLDTRTRQEGLDLFYRVQRVFPSGEAVPAGRVVSAVLALAGLFLTAGPARAGEPPLEAVRAVRAGVQAVREEVRKAEPYPGGGRWVGRLRDLGRRLERSGDGSGRAFRWFGAALDGFNDRNRDDALRVLDDLQRRLAVAEEALAPPRPDAAEAGGRPPPSPDEVKALLRRQGPPVHSEEKKTPEKKGEVEEPEKRDVDPDDLEPRGRRVSGHADPSLSAAGFSTLGWLILAGLAAAVVVGACLLFLQARRGPETDGKPRAKPAREQEVANVPLPENRSADELWREAEALAGKGQYREAVRLLYLAVLFVLDRKRLLRYEPTRTNGEYVRQVRLAEEAPAELHAPFERLTALFERKWYGDRTCEPDEHDACKTLAREVRERAA